jgi:hypothetical protein
MFSLVIELKIIKYRNEETEEIEKIEKKCEN